MTAQLAIMNQQGVAIASDSAVTISNGKVYYTADKIFRLNGTMAIMINGLTAFMNTPWETIIKLYRDQVARKPFTTLQACMDDFIRHLDQPGRFSPEPLQNRYFETMVYGYYELIKEKIDEQLKNSGNNPKKKKGECTVSEIIGMYEAEWLQYSRLSHLPKSYEKSLLRSLKPEINPMIREVFKDLRLSRRDKTRLVRIAGMLFSRNHFPENSTGLVFCGYGREEIFPAVYEVCIEAVVNNRLKYAIRKQGRIDYNTTSTILPFAQSQTARTIIEGIAPGMKEKVTGLVENCLDDIIRVLSAEIPGLADKNGQGFHKILQSGVRDAHQKFEENTQKLIRKDNVDEIVDTVYGMPIDSLAAMAEALVSIEALRQQMRFRRESVGGPIDVAVITRGSGFQWVKKKSHFNHTDGLHQETGG